MTSASEADSQKSREGEREREGVFACLRSCWAVSVCLGLTLSDYISGCLQSRVAKFPPLFPSLFFYHIFLLLTCSLGSTISLSPLHLLRFLFFFSYVCFCLLLSPFLSSPAFLQSSRLPRFRFLSPVSLLSSRLAFTSSLLSLFHFPALTFPHTTVAIHWPDPPSKASSRIRTSMVPCSFHFSIFLVLSMLLLVRVDLLFSQVEPFLKLNPSAFLLLRAIP